MFYEKVSPHFHNRIGDVMGSVLASSADDRVFEPLSGQTKNYTVGFTSLPPSAYDYEVRVNTG